MTNARAYVFAAAMLAAAPVAAEPLPNAIAAGTVGERYDGYMGFAAEPAPGVRRQVNAVNIKRRTLYIQLASGKNATAELVGLTTACELFSQLRVGTAYLLQDGVWRRRAPGQGAPQPQHCR